jgi:thioredoxin 1
MLALSDITFDKYLHDDMPTVVMFHAAFAGPCLLAKPEFEKAASRAGNRIRFATFDLDGNPNTPERFGVRGIPLFVLFKDGIPHNPTIGAIDCEKILEIIDVDT